MFNYNYAVKVICAFLKMTQLKKHRRDLSIEYVWSNIISLQDLQFYWFLPQSPKPGTLF